MMNEDNVVHPTTSKYYACLNGVEILTNFLTMKDIE